MANRPVIDEPGFEHGANGYRHGCGCGTCTEGHRKRIAAARAKNRAVTASATASMGKVERTVRRELKESSGFTPPWVQSLHELAIRLAHAVDNSADDKISPLSARLVQVLDRIRSAGPTPRGAVVPDVGDEAEEFVNGLRKLGSA